MMGGDCGVANLEMRPRRDPCSLPDDMDDNTQGTFYLLNNETLAKPCK